MTGYGAVPQSDAPRGEERDPSFFLSKGAIANFLAGSEDETAVVPRVHDIGSSYATITFKVSPDSWRFVAYLFFWFMCIFAILVTKFVTADILLAGPTDGSTCPPFEPNGEGFDIYTNSHLMRAFGFNNICSNWDYTPSRELTAMVYPLFEYSLLVYLCLDFLNDSLAYKRGYVSSTYWSVAKVTFPFKLVLCAWFRMIFVVIAYVDVQGHTAGFLGLQIALVLLAVENTYYVLDAGIAYNILGGIRGTRIAAFCYLFGILVTSSIKLYLTGYVVYNGSYPLWALSPSGIAGKNVGEVVDVFWMIFNAVLPLFISFVRARSEKPLIISVDVGSPVRSSEPMSA